MKITKNSKDRVKINQIFPVMQEHFGKSMNLARIKLMAMMIHAWCVVQTVSLHKLVAAMLSDVRRDSNIRRLQRFMAHYALNLDLIAKMIFSLLPVKTGLVLSMDRTNWKFGQTNINILMLAVTYKGVAFPLIFKLMDKRGNSNQDERIKRVEKFISLLGKDCIRCLVADREFVGKDWIGWLNTYQIRYYIRIRQNFWIRNPKSSEDVRVYRLFNIIRLGEEYCYRKQYPLKGEYVYLAGARLKDSQGEPELQILICYNYPDETIPTYRERWQIETCFRAMKSSVFDIEASHLYDIDRITQFVAIVCIVLVWAYLVGEHKDLNIKPIRILNNGYRAKSTVKYGLEEIADMLSRPWRKPELDIFKFLSCS